LGAVADKDLAVRTPTKVVILVPLGRLDEGAVGTVGLTGDELVSRDDINTEWHENSWDF